MSSMTVEEVDTRSELRGRLRVMVVDDEPDVRRVVRMALERRAEFVVVAEAGDGSEAVSIVERAQPHLILLDLDMPHVGGLEALPALRAAVPGACVVAFTGLPREPMEPLARSAGAIGFLEKGVPSRRLGDELVSLIALLGVVEGALDSRSVALDGDLAAPRAARRFVTETLAEWDVEDGTGSVELLVSELVTNAILHGRSRPDVAVILTQDVVRVEVHDDDAALPVVRQAAPEDVTGRGLDLVVQLARAWGVRPDTNGGKAVWFEIPRRARGNPPLDPR